ncbi:MAG: SUMF1/EgtB/PvdO family nonheme iron enzyme [Proteobacteria bacterium]|nr:SUMF1/EgtB/PvdO family nonheme iron enzyme [Pseudomonadota bacterium]
MVRGPAMEDIGPTGAGFGRWARVFAAALALAVVSGGGAATAAENRAKGHIPRLVHVPGGEFIAGSSPAERERAYGLDEAAYGHSVTRRDRWYENEPARATRRTGAYSITATPITNHQYAAFIAATGHGAPDMDFATWKSYGLIHPYGRTRRHAWAAGAAAKGPGTPSGGDGLPRRCPGLRGVAHPGDRQALAVAQGSGMGKGGTGNQGGDVPLGRGLRCPAAQ